MGFGLANTSEDTPAISETVYTSWSRRLANKLYQRNKTRRMSTRGWDDQFQKLHELDHVGQEWIEKVLTWYLDHLGEEMIPEAYSAKGFRQKFTAISKAMERSGILPDIVLDKEGQCILTTLLKKHWSGSQAKLLPQAIQLSLDNYRDFLTRVKKVRDELTPQPAKSTPIRQIRVYDPELMFCHHILARHGSAAHFVEVWFHELYAWLHRKGWGGSLKEFAVSLNNQKFQWTGANWAVHYAGSCHLWDKLSERIQHREDN